MDINLENYEFYNDLFLAETELFSSMVSIGADIVNESNGIISIQEDAKETINNYIQKIIQAIQNAWDRFKEIVMNEKDDIWLKAHEKKILESQPTFTINNYPEYDMNKLSSIKLIPLNYEEMKESLSSKEAFMAKYYGELEGEGSISDKLEKIILKSRKDERCTNELLKNCYKFCLSDSKSEISKIELDLKTINDSNKNIERIVNSISTDQTTREAAIMYESYLYEVQNQEKISFTDDKNGADANNKTSLVSDIHIYISCSSDILTAKMNLLKNIKKEYMNILKHLVGGGENKEDNKKPSNKSNSNKEIKI